jgi:hypothetical protein
MYVADMPGFRSLARNRDFTVLWTGATVSELGSAISRIAFPLLAFALTHSTGATAIAEACFLVGSVGLLLPAGIAADRIDKRLLLRLSSAVGTLAYASLVVAALTHHLSIVQLCAAALITGACDGIVFPTEQSAVRSIVATEELPTALSQVQGRQWIAALIGGPVGGALFSVARWIPFAADAVSYAANWVLLGRLRADLSPAAPSAGSAQANAPAANGTEPSPGRKVLHDLVDGWRFLFSHPFFRVLLPWGALTNLTTNAFIFVAILRMITAGYPGWQIGLVQTAVGIAGVCGAIAAPWIIERVPTGRLLIIVAWSFIPMMLPVAYWSDPLVIGAALMAGVFINPASNAGIGSYAASQTPADMQGRLTATRSFTSQSIMPLAPVVAGGAYAWLGGTGAALLIAGLCVGVATIPTLSKAMWRIPRPAQWAADADAARGVAATAGRGTDDDQESALEPYEISEPGLEPEVGEPDPDLADGAHVRAEAAAAS